MKRLLIALVAAVAVSTGFARVTDPQGFETGFDAFVPDFENEDASELVAYDNDEPGFDAPYDFDDFGLKYLSLDTGDATLWRTNADDAAYFDMVMQFNPSASAPTLDPETKIAVYLNSSSNLVVLAGGESTPTEYPYTTSEIAPGTWARLTIAKNGTSFDVYLNTTKIGTYASLTGDASIKSVGFKGSGALDDFVARTTDPFYTGDYVASIGNGGEKYATLDAALADDPTATFTLNGDATTTKVLANRGDSISIELNGHSLSGLTAAGLLVPVVSTSGDVTTYTADYFPRTATAGQDGTAEHPFEVADVDDLQALSAAVAADATAFAGKCYVQTADIDMTSAGAFAGIGTYDKVPTSGKPFVGTYDGQGYTISNVQRAGGDTQGIFNQVGVGGVVENLVVSNMYWDVELSGKYGFAIVGNAGGGATLRNLTAAGTFGSAGKPSTHNIAGIVVRLCGGATSGVATTIDSCTNNATIYGGYTKLGGICAIVQQQTGFVDGKVVFENCANNGTLVCKRTATDVTGNAGIIGYASASNVELTACYSNGNITNVDGANTDKDGALIGWQYTGYTLTDNGGNSAPADKKMVAHYGNAANVTGFQYATVDNGIATTIAPPYTLAKDAEYLLEGSVGEGTVYTFDAAGTIAFNTNGYNFAGTVEVDRSTLMSATSETVDAVVTFTAEAGVASVDNLAYATFEDAVAALDGETEDDFVTLLADVSPTISAGTTLNVKTGTHKFTPVVAADVILTSTPGENDIITFTATEGMAKCNDKWYATFTAAYDAARAYLGNATMVVKITDDFTPAITATYNHFYSLEFIDARADQTEGLTINLKNAAGTAYMASSRYFFPANATLVLAADFIHANATGIISGGTLEIPEDVTVTINVSPYWAFYKLDGSAGISAIAGTGTILLPNNTFDGSTVSKTMFNSPNRCFPSLLRNNSWQGTLELVGTSDDKVCDLSQVANPGSKIRFNGFTAPTFGDTNSTYAMGIELVGDGLTLTGDYTRNYTFTGSLKGSGSLSVANTKPTSLMFTGDVSGFTGNVAASGTSSAITFGSATIGSGQRIVVGGGESVTNAADATWTAENVVVSGELVANGTMSATKLWGDSGTGVYRANNSAAAIAVASSWNGTYYANFDSGNVRSAFDVATSASATTVINGANGVFSGFPRFDSAAPNVAGSVVLNANWTIGDGWASNKTSGASNATTFANLSGGGNLTVDGTASGTDPIYYCITTLDGYTGVLGGKRGAFVVDKVNVATQPTNGARVVKTAIGANGSINNNVPLYVGGTDTTKTLTYDANGADGAGLYYFAPVATVSITVPAVQNATATVTTNGVAVAGDGTYTVEEGATVTITYAPNAGYVLSGTSVYTIESATEGSTITITDTTVGAEIADVYRNYAKVAGYTSIRAAIAAAQAGDTVRLVADDTVSFEEVVVTERIPSGGSIVIDKNLTIDGAGFKVYGVSNAEILNATGSATPGYDMVADLVNGSNLIGFFVKSGNVTFNDITLTEFGDTAYVNKFGYTPIQTASAYTGNLVLTGVSIDKFNRTAVCVRGGTLAMTGGTVTANATHKTNDHFQQPIEVRGGTATLNGVTVDSDVAYSNGGGAIVAWGNATLTNVNVDFTGVGIWADTPTVAVVGESTSITATDKALFAEEGGTINVSAGTFTGTLAVDSDPNSAISITGGTFDSDVNEYCASGYGAFIEGGVYVVSEAVTVTFSSAQGTAPAAQKIKKGTAVAKPADPTAEGYTFKGWTLNDAAYDFAMLVNEDITLVAQWEESQTDDWNTPATDADVADSLEEDGITTDTEVVETVEEFNALVNYITNHVSGASAPTDLSVNQKANAVLCFALNAETIPDKEITSADVTIDSVAKTGDAGAVAVTVSIAGVTPGESVPSTTLEKIVTAKGGTSLGSMSTENVTVSGLGTADGKVNITVTPKNVGSTPTSFFTSVIINK